MVPTIKVSPETHRLLTRAKGLLTYVRGQPVDFDEIVREAVKRLLEEVGGRE